MFLSKHFSPLVPPWTIQAAHKKPRQAARTRHRCEATVELMATQTSAFDAVPVPLVTMNVALSLLDVCLR
jgi:hypothetical protein